MSWSSVFDVWWLPMAEVLHYNRTEILELTLDEFQQAVTYTGGRQSGGG